MFWQATLLGALEPRFDVDFVTRRRVALDERTWVDHAPGWLVGGDDLLDELRSTLPLRQRTGVRMYDRVVDEPRLSSWWSAADGDPEPNPMLAGVRVALATRYREPFDSIGFNLYRDGSDSVAWHADRHAHIVTNPVIAIVSLGAPRPFRIRPSGGGASRTWSLGEGDLLVMGGACQHEWEHCVPKVRTTTGPRLSITFRAV